MQTAVISDAERRLRASVYTDFEKNVSKTANETIKTKSGSKKATIILNVIGGLFISPNCRYFS
jgi:hypothetical protein